MLLSTVAPLLVATLAGVVLGALRLFSDPAQAIAALNRLSLYLLFPALIFANVYAAELALAGTLGFVLVSVLPSVILLGGVAWLSRKVEPDARAALGLGAMMGNIAYLGIPLCAALIGPQVIGLASLSAALHLLFGLPLGALVLLRWGRRAPDPGRRSPIAEVARQPLIWAPILALLARLLPSGVVEPILIPARFIGASASPVALVMIGLYVHEHRRELTTLRWTDAGLITAKLLVLPALAFAGVVLGLRLGLLALEPAKVVIVQAAMPTAITTFALAEEYGVGREPIVRGIVGTTLVFVLTFWLLPPVLALL